MHAGIEGAFTVLRFDGGDRLSVVEPLTTALYPEENFYVGRYDVAFSHLRARALNIPASRDFISELIKEEAWSARLAWVRPTGVKSGFSSGGDNCVEVAFAHGVAGIRDSNLDGVQGSGLDRTV
ncbi:MULTISPECIES: DUF397 domain-containing protein [unclassified Streptomyces]|uniref:DUF397 domain-containing protein n=1 Tax=unclassified Streptomyces TaxID=2593676 RepID=UPI00384B54C2